MHKLVTNWHKNVAAAATRILQLKFLSKLSTKCEVKNAKTRSSKVEPHVQKKIDQDLGKSCFGSTRININLMLSVRMMNRLLFPNHDSHDTKIFYFGILWIYILMKYDYYFQEKGFLISQNMISILPNMIFTKYSLFVTKSDFYLVKYEFYFAKYDFFFVRYHFYFAKYDFISPNMISVLLNIISMS